MLCVLRQVPVLFVLMLSFLLAASLSSQTPSDSPPAPSPAAAPAFKPNYPESASGLEHLAKDILKAQAQNDGARADALLKSLIMPDAYDWYDHFFGRDAADVVGEYYEKAAPSIAPFLAHIFVDIQRQDFSRIKVLRYENSCDDDAAEDAYGVLLRRREPFPIYEVRFRNGDRFIRLFPVAFVDGAFRYFLSPEFRPPATTQNNSQSDNNPAVPRRVPSVGRVTIGGTVQAARLISKVQPVYPEKARKERVSGTVKIHAIIGKDGQVSHINGVRGFCSLAESAVAAVRQWRYQPTLLIGNPVEVDTEIDVIFSLVQ
jgi:TonB family protein